MSIMTHIAGNKMDHKTIKMNAVEIIKHPNQINRRLSGIAVDLFYEQSGAHR